ncbi:MAG: 2-amino-4-hydroxy-6-hydroxymethyldihydropteridine diphosphokinase [Janthinobacterium lividum]
MYGITKEGINHTNIATAYIGLGSNLGDRETHLETALSELRSLPTMKVTQVSSVYETAPVGLTDQPDFLNMVAEIQTSLSPLALLSALLHIENKIGRVRTIRWGPRVIDLDLLLFGHQEIALPELTVPHPRLRERAFAMIPLSEIAPELMLPGDEKTASEIAKILFSDGNILDRSFV